jgi:hypothetical protein
MRPLELNGDRLPRPAHAPQPAGGDVLSMLGRVASRSPSARAELRARACRRRLRHRYFPTYGEAA